MTALLRVFDGPSALGDHSNLWRRLLEHGGPATFFLQPAWLDLWQRHYLNGRHFQLLVAERDGQWIGGLPVIRGKGRIGRWRVRKVEVAGAPFFDFIEVPAVDEAARVETLRLILRWFREAARDCSILDLRELADPGPSLGALHEASTAEQIPLFTRLCSRAPQVDLALFSQQGVRSRNLRSQLRRTEQRLSERGRVEIRFETPAANLIEPLLLECAGVEATSWKGLTGVGVLREGVSRAWAMDVFREMTATGSLLLATMRLNGRLIGYHWGFRDGARFLSYNQAQIPDYGDLGAGTVLQHHMLLLGADLGLQVIDASRGSLERPHILARYRGPVRDHVQAMVYQTGLPGAALRIIRHSVLPKLRGHKSAAADLDREPSD